MRGKRRSFQSKYKCKDSHIPNCYCRLSHREHEVSLFGRGQTYVHIREGELIEEYSLLLLSM